MNIIKLVMKVVPLQVLYNIEFILKPATFPPHYTCV